MPVLIEHIICESFVEKQQGATTDKVLDLVTKTKFQFKIMKFVVNFEKLVPGS